MPRELCYYGSRDEPCTPGFVESTDVYVEWEACEKHQAEIDATQPDYTECWWSEYGGDCHGFMEKRLDPFVAEGIYENDGCSEEMCCDYHYSRRGDDL